MQKKKGKKRKEKNGEKINYALFTVCILSIIGYKKKLSLSTHDHAYNIMISLE